jgi:hypothetical protein
MIFIEDLNKKAISRRRLPSSGGPTMAARAVSGQPSTQRSFSHPPPLKLQPSPKAMADRKAGRQTDTDLCAEASESQKGRLELKTYRGAVGPDVST